MRHVFLSQAVTPDLFIHSFIGGKFEKYFGIRCKLPVKYCYLIGVKKVFLAL